ncbi:hypothetical protein L917_12924 [Phytophthora nicotianae]|uniref:Uncharacterized protein n=2 Tax=Phytophthora nicotianae TaxID=4792 RepID=W2KSA8_PHYNI|nr:hypothetical protein L917_12924 [Phytophthora nicotianae]
MLRLRREHHAIQCRLAYYCMAVITGLIAAATTPEAMNQATPAVTTAPNLRVGMIKLKDGNRTADVVVVLLDGSKSENTPISKDNSSVYNFTQLDIGDSSATEERAIPTGSWLKALRNFFKNPVLFTKSFIKFRTGKFFHTA